MQANRSLPALAYVCYHVLDGAFKGWGREINELHDEMAEYAMGWSVCECRPIKVEIVVRDVTFIWDVLHVLAVPTSGGTAEHM